MEIKTPPAFMVVDVAAASYAGLITDVGGAHDQLMGWLIEEGLDPQEIKKIEIFDRDSPLTETSLWARITDTEGSIRVEGLGTCPPLRVRMIIGVYPGTSREYPPKSDTSFKNGHTDDPVPPFPSLSPREIPDDPSAVEAAMQNAQRAEFAYRAYAIGHGLTDAFGEPVERWEEASNCCRQAWETVATALTAEIRSEQVIREALAKSVEQAEALGVIAKALDELPEGCRYHGSNTGPQGFPYPWTREACCDTGVPAQRRKRAEGALAELRELLGDV